MNSEEFESAIVDHIQVIQSLRAQQSLMRSIAGAMQSTIQRGGKILWCGNGGSAADAQHLAAELVGRFRRERSGLASIALTTDTSIMTAVSNDYGFEQVFSRQVKALGNPADLVVGISTSGNSPNVVKALEVAKSLGIFSVAFTGMGGGRLAGLANLTLAIPSQNTARIQEAHIFAGHMLCEWIDSESVESAVSADVGKSNFIDG